ncbi:MAG: F0F1 ATP synthase subunit B [Thermoguttaceae bacterium]
MKTARFCLLILASLVCASGSLSCSSALAQEHAAEESADTSHGSEHGGDPNPLAVDLDLAIWTGGVFALLFFVLSKFAWPQISAALEEREKRIEDNIAAAQGKHEEAKLLLAQHEAKLATAADDVRALLEEARRDAEHTKAQILVEAKQAAEAERDRAVRDIKRAADNELKSWAETSADLAVDLASHVVRQDITAEQQAQLVRDALSKLAITEPSEN